MEAAMFVVLYMTVCLATAGCAQVPVVTPPLTLEDCRALTEGLGSRAACVTKESY